MNPNDAAMAAMVSAFPETGQTQDIWGAPGVPQPQAPVYMPPAAQPLQQQPQAPYQPPQPPAPQQYPWPAVQQPQVQPQAPVQPQQPQMQPQGPQPEYAIAPVAPVADQNTPPAWAQGLIQTVQGLQQAQQQPPAAPQPGDDWADRPTSWGGLKQAITTEAERIAQAKIDKMVADQQAAAQQSAQIQQQADAAIDGAFNQLRQTGFMPAVANPNDQNDPGKLAERELLGYALSMGAQAPEHLLTAAPALKAHHDAGYYFDYTQKKLVRRGSQTAAAQAPIAGASPSITGGGTVTGPTQAQLANLSLDQMAALGQQMLQQQ